ncbi:MAG: UDP-N-acetylmuramate dehydrogenase [Nitrospirae bacterium]|jgi:UDP-N-acetylmuramate dehydrogenase|nr:UDP-N-acetylmuramate dehydrogenase [Nitrospirota bacterium]
MIKPELREIFSGSLFEGEIKFMEPMSSHTSLRIGGNADIYALPADIPSLIGILINLKNNGIPFFALGGGTNILVRDNGIEGAVISLKSFKNITKIKEDGDSVIIYAGSGVLLQRFVNYCKENGYKGIEELAGIPGTIGGAIYGNAGSFGLEIKDVLYSIDIMNEAGLIKRFTPDSLNFGYRTSGISSGNIIIGAEIKLKKGDKKEIAEKIGDFLKIKKEKQPIWEPSAGCVFKNPPGLYAGRLIEEAGCKGLRVGDVEVSNLHANFFINKGRAKADDFLKLMEIVLYRVKRKTGIILEPEIKIIGRDEIAEG